MVSRKNPWGSAVFFKIVRSAISCRMALLTIFWKDHVTKTLAVQLHHVFTFAFLSLTLHTVVSSHSVAWSVSTFICKLRYGCFKPIQGHWGCSSGSNFHICGPTVSCYHACLHICLTHRRFWVWAPEESHTWCLLLQQICCHYYLLLSLLGWG